MKRTGLSLTGLLLLACLFTGARGPLAQSATVQPVRAAADLAALQKRVEQVVAKARPTVVAIRMTGSSGSGCLISEDGWISTCGHVTGSRPGTKCRVILHGGEILDAETFGWHEDLDYALVKADTKGRKLPFSPLGDSTKLIAGEWLVAMGHPLGPEPGRDAVVRAGRCLAPDNGRGLVVMDAPVISGDSGGPVFNLAGEVVAINQSIQGNNVSINIVTPSVPFRDMLGDLKARKGFGNAQRPQWGRGTGRAQEGALNNNERRQYEDAMRALQDRDLKASCDAFDALLAAPRRPPEVLYNAACAYSLHSDKSKGKEKDALVQKALNALRRATEAGWADMDHAAEDTDLDPIRDHKDFKEWMAAGRRAGLRPVLGMTLRQAAGLRVDEVIPGSPAQRAGVQKGDIIERVGPEKIEGIGDWLTWAIQKGITESDTLRVVRAGKRVELAISMPSIGARVFGQGGGRILELVEGGLAFSAGLRVDDVIIKVGDTSCDGALEFVNAMMLAPANEEVLLEVKRGFGREKVKFSYSTGEVGPAGVLPRDDWKQGAKLLALWDKLLADKAQGLVFPLRQKGKQVAFATVVRKDGLLLTKASQIDKTEKFELVDGTAGLEAAIVARSDRYDLALVKVARTFAREVVFDERPFPLTGTLLATVDAKGRALAHGFVALPEYDSDRLIGEPDPNGPYMGIGARTADSGGAEITTVTAGMPAAKGGLRVGDVVKKLGGQVIDDWPSMMAMIQSCRPDETITLEVQRGETRAELSITLMPRAQALGQQAPTKGTGKAELGISGSKPREGGLEIGFVRPGSPAELAGIATGEILLKFNGRPLPDQKALDAAVSALAVGDKVTLTLKRGSTVADVEVELAEQDAPPPPPGQGRPNVKGPVNTRYTYLGVVIQHDSVVLPSQQGSPIFDVQGNVIGINIARADRTRTFALSAQRVGPVLKELMRGVR